MKRRSFRNKKQLTAACVFLLLSALLLWCMTTLRGQREWKLEQVREEAERTSAEDLKRVQRELPECGYVKSRLQQVRLVHTCEDVAGERFQIYEAERLYQRNGTEEWEASALVPESYLIYQETPEGELQWIGEFQEYNAPETDAFENQLHQTLMQLDDRLLYQLQADVSLETALQQTLSAYMEKRLPGDDVVFQWKPLATDDGTSGTAYGLLLFYTFSGSPMIYLPETGRYDSAIYSAYFLPIAVSYQQDQAGRYAVTDLWEPKKDTYEADVRVCFPPETAERVLQDLDSYLTDSMDLDAEMLKMAFFPAGPTWAEYHFSPALTDADLCGLAYYYGDQDIYTKHVREEVLRRFSRNSSKLLNALGRCEQAVQDSVCSLLEESDIPASTGGLTQAGKRLYERVQNGSEPVED